MTKNPNMQVSAAMSGQDAAMNDCQRVVPKRWYKYADEWLMGYDTLSKAESNQ